MKKYLFSFALLLCSCFSFSISAQITKEKVEKHLDDYFQKREISHKGDKYWVYTDSLVVMGTEITYTNKLGMLRSEEFIWSYIMMNSEDGKRYWEQGYTLDRSPKLFSDLKNPFISENQIKTSNYKSSLFSKMSYADAMYYRFLYTMFIDELEVFDEMTDEVRNIWVDLFFRNCKTGLWVVKNELDAFGDLADISLSCPFYAKRMKDGTIEAANLPFFVNVSKDNIRFISDGFQYFPASDSYVLTIKDADNNKLSCSLDNKLNITSNALSFLRFIERGGIIKGNITLTNRGVSYGFSLYVDGFNAAKQATGLETSSITNDDKTNTGETNSITNDNKTNTGKTSSITDNKTNTKKRRSSIPFDYYVGTYEITDKNGKKFTITVKEDETATIVDRNNNTFYCSATKLYTGELWIKATTAPNIIINKSRDYETKNKWYYLYEGWLYSDIIVLEAKDPNLRLKVTKIK